jgi:high-affinity nickel-transport protein
LPDPAGGRARVGAICVILITANAAAWSWAWLAFAGNPALLASAVLAYGFGLRHAVDADHIAAIDNATRKLIEVGRDARTTGLFFSLGHATVVVLATVAVALSSVGLQTVFVGLKPLAGIFSTAVSATCLFALAIVNGVILITVCRVLAAVRRGERPLEAGLDRLTAQPGLLGRLLRGLLRLVSRSWHLYPLGFVFGLGFDTASEIGLLGVSAAQAANGLPIAAIMVFPALFTAGMMLLDTLDGIMMAGAYRWATSEPLRKLHYNLVITLISVVVASVVGGIELAGLATGDDAAGWFRPMIAALNDNLSTIGVAIIVLFALTWIGSVFAARLWPARRGAASG